MSLIDELKSLGADVDEALDRVIREYLNQYTIADLMQFGQPGDDYVI